MSELARENILRIKPYVPGKPIEEVARELRLKGEIIKLASNENPLGPSPLAIKALQKTEKNLNFYPDDGCFYLTKALAQKMGIAEDELIIGNGSVEILDFIALAFINPGDEVIMVDQGFIMYPIVAAIANAKQIIVPLKDARHNLDAMADAVTDRTKVILIANPNNPTGTMNTAEEVDRFMKRIPENVLVVFDEAYHEYISRPDYPQTFQYFRAGRNVIVLRTFSKIYGLAGIRLGYGIARHEIIDALRRVRVPFNVNTSAQVGGLAALDDEDHVRRSIEVNEEGKEFLYHHFKTMEQPYIPTEANFIFLQTGLGGEQLARALLKEGVIVRFLPAQDQSGIRITIGTRLQNQKLITTMKKLI